jgi:hypothetical protein
MNPIEKLSTLTERQREVLRLFCDGLTYKTIGEKLFIAVPTVKSHMGNIYVKLDLFDLPPPKRRIRIAEQYCPLLRDVDLSPAPPDETDEPEPVPEPIMRMVEEDERAIVLWEPKLPAIIEPQSREIVKYQPIKSPPIPPPRRSRWLLVGMILGALLIVSIVYEFSGEQWAEEPLQDTTKVPVVENREVTHEVTVVVTATPAPPQPTLTSIVQTQEATVAWEDTPTPAPPTPIPASPTPTHLPTPTVPENTTPGSILEIGDSWRQNGVRLRLEEVSLSPRHECLTLMFNFFNDTDHVIVVTIEEEDFSARDNLDRRWRLITISEGGTACRNGWISELSQAVEPGERFRLSYNAWVVSFTGFVSDTSVNEVIVTVDGLSQISNARWRIPIYH